MKISDRTHPIIKAFNYAIKTGDIMLPNETGGALSLEHEPIYLSHLDKLFKRASKNISVMSVPFYAAFAKSYNKLSDLFRREVIKLDPQCGVMILQNIMYVFDITETHTTVTILTPVNQRDSPGIILSCIEDIQKGTWVGFADTRESEFLLRGMEEYAKGKDFNQVANSLALMDIKMLLLFKKYCEIETKFVKANSKAKDINCKYVNDTRSDITILNSTWFTTLVHSDAFKVRGHFRLQPYGEGMKEKKLIWIADFEKHGYTRQFKRPINIQEAI